MLQGLAELLELGPVPRDGAVTICRHENLLIRGRVYHAWTDPADFVAPQNFPAEASAPTSLETAITPQFAIEATGRGPRNT
jgi:hypothetical protein